MKERKNNVNTLLWLMVTLSVMVMFSLVCLSSCNSSVNSNGKGGKTPNPGPKTVKITVIAPEKGGSIKVNGEVLKETKEFTPKIGDTLTFEAVINDGYEFKGWKPTTLGTEKTTTLKVSEDYKVHIELEEKDPDDSLEFVKKYIKFNKDDDIVYSTSGLGFGRKGDDSGIYYHGYNTENNKLMAMNVEEEEKNSEDFKKAEITEDFTSIYDGLDKRWLALYNSELKSNAGWIDRDGMIMCNMLTTNYNILLDLKKEAIYMYINSGALNSYYMDFHVAFVHRYNPNKGYSVHFSNLIDKNGRKEYEPYLTCCSNQVI